MSKALVAAAQLPEQSETKLFDGTNQFLGRDDWQLALAQAVISSRRVPMTSGYRRSGSDFASFSSSRHISMTSRTFGMASSNESPCA
jgi:hypothetical protein